ncbi:14-3-3 protein epsilon [Anaeramoeba flamelloides]|uniref:14-3-3 protein epsilon n=1 Tax=Anaeramoeba flamelloides TaxID=1746091 RepID=A0AAV7ZV01_9EUKA|nr:14-3-3 protein epsilon [Anaeramoeba flamelloides]
MDLQVRKSIVRCAKICEEAERYEEMAEVMKQLVTTDVELTTEERKLLNVSFLNVLRIKMSSWRSINSSLQKEKNKNLDYVKTLEQKIMVEIQQICDQTTKILDEHLLLKSTNFKNKAFYFKMKGDCYRHLAEFQSGEKKETAIEECFSAYQAGLKIAYEHLPPTNPTRIGIALNLSVFFCDILHSADKACRLGKQAFDDALLEIDQLTENDYQDTTLVLGLLKDNLSLWNSEFQD